MTGYMSREDARGSDLENIVVVQHHEAPNDPWFSR